MRATILIAACLGLFAMPIDPTPPNTVALSQMMRELSAQPGFTEAFLAQVQGGAKKKSGAALLTPELVHHLRDLILGKDWEGLDHFPGWTMAEINPTVRVVGHFAGKDQQIGGMATAGGRPATDAAKSALALIDLGTYGPDNKGTANLDTPSTFAGFDEKALVSTIGDGVTRGDGPNPQLAPLHAESQRLADVLNRLSLNEPGGPQFQASIRDHVVSSPEQLVAALLATGHTVELADARYFANFGHLHYKGQDVMMPFYANSQIIVPGTRRPLLVPVAHAEYEWRIFSPQKTGPPKLTAAVSFYFGIDGKCEFRTMDQLDQAWVMVRHAHEYRGAEAIEVTRLNAAMVRAYMRLHAAHPAIPFGGYYAFGVCQDVVAAIELRMTGKATLFPNTADERFFTDPQDAEINDLIKRLPKDRAGKPPQVERIFASLPVGESDTDLATVSIPGLGAELVAVHDAWTNGTLERVHPRWWRWGLIGSIAFVLIAGASVGWARRRKHST